MLCAAERKPCSFLEFSKEGGPTRQFTTLSRIVLGDDDSQEPGWASAVKPKQKSPSVSMLQAEVTRLRNKIARLRKEEGIKEEVRELQAQQVSVAAVLNDVRTCVEGLADGLLKKKKKHDKGNRNSKGGDRKSVV